MFLLEEQAFRVDPELLSLPVSVPAPDWTDAACANTDRLAWFPETREAYSAEAQAAARAEQITRLQRICGYCPLGPRNPEQPCLNYALANGEEYGVWGGEDLEAMTKAAAAEAAA